MKNLNRELLLNVVIVAPILALMGALFASRINDPSPIDFGPFLPLLIALLTLYPFNVCVSLVNYFIVQQEIELT
ncbi:MAG TPA: hypothetical protein VGI33_16605 [Paenibacillus sp.]|jgi:cation transporter-like permease